jgi:hypothetical protein
MLAMCALRPFLMLRFFDAIGATAGHCLRAGLMAALLMGLSACSTLQFTYQQGATLTYWWMDAYVDFKTEQAAPTKAALERWFAWHRRGELPKYEAWLQALAEQSLQSVTPTALCERLHQVQHFMRAGYDHAIPDLATVAATLDATQLDHLAQRYAKKDGELEQDYLHERESTWRATMQERWLEQLEGLYGSLTAEQHKLLARALQQLPVDPHMWLAERRTRHAEVLSTLSHLKAQDAKPVDYERAFTRFADQTMLSPRVPYRSYRARLEQAQCSVVANLHQLASPEQRKRARDRILRYRDDVRALIAARS